MICYEFIDYCFVDFVIPIEGSYEGGYNALYFLVFHNRTIQSESIPVKSVVFLAAPEAAHINGEVLRVDGGTLA